MPRSDLLYRRFELTQVPPGRRDEVLNLKLAAWRPRPDTQYWIGWQGAIAHVWAWDKDQSLERRGREIPIPESVLYSPLEQGVRLVACMNGVEGQYWARGVLRQSRWWSNVPSDGAWHSFLRAAQLPPAAPPPVERIEWASRAWARRRTGGQPAWLELERPVVTGVAILMMAAYGWLFGVWWQGHQALTEHQARLDTLQQQAAPELEARERALDERTRAQNLVRLSPAVRPLELLDQVSAALPDNLRLVRWEQTSDQLLLGLEGDTVPEPERIVRALEAVPLLSGVLAERGRRPQGIDIRAELGN